MLFKLIDFKNFLKDPKTETSIYQDIDNLYLNSIKGGESKSKAIAEKLIQDFMSQKQQNFKGFLLYLFKKIAHKAVKIIYDKYIQKKIKGYLG